MPSSALSGTGAYLPIATHCGKRASENTLRTSTGDVTATHFLALCRELRCNRCPACHPAVSLLYLNRVCSLCLRCKIFPESSPPKRRLAGSSQTLGPARRMRSKALSRAGCVSLRQPALLRRLASSSTCPESTHEAPARRRLHQQHGQHAKNSQPSTASRPGVLIQLGTSLLRTPQTPCTIVAQLLAFCDGNWSEKIDRRSSTQRTGRSAVSRTLTLQTPWTSTSFACARV